MNAQTILHFWFNEIDSQFWFKKDDNFDQKLITRFYELNRSAARGELYHWREDIYGRLAEIIVLDQFSRNMFRGDARSFESDPLALVLAQEALASGADQKLSPKEKSFLYMPYMHSESLAIHQVALELFKQPGLEGNYDFELKHLKIIERFGRYPHRNEVLGRQSTPEEIEFLKGPGSSF
jgi:uncharacterized protein (DUF924 family)